MSHCSQCGGAVCFGRWVRLIPNPDHRLLTECEARAEGLVFENANVCGCDESLIRRTKLRRVGLKLAERYLRTIEPTRFEYGRGGHYPGDAHKRWSERFQRVRAMMGGE